VIVGPFGNGGVIRNDHADTMATAQKDLTTLNQQSALTCQ
jgi:hypothetical protein